MMELVRLARLKLPHAHKSPELKVVALCLLLVIPLTLYSGDEHFSEEVREQALTHHPMMLPSVHVRDLDLDDYDDDSDDEEDELPLEVLLPKLLKERTARAERTGGAKAEEAGLFKDADSSTESAEAFIEAIDELAEGNSGVDSTASADAAEDFIDRLDEFASVVAGDGDDTAEAVVANEPEGANEAEATAAEADRVVIDAAVAREFEAELDAQEAERSLAEGQEGAEGRAGEEGTDGE